MPLPKNLIGVDMAADNFALTAYDSEKASYSKAQTFDNDPEGLAALQTYLDQSQMTSSDTIFCLEATGVYVEPLVHFLAAKGYRVAVEAPHKTKRAFYPLGPKTDPLDSRQIAEYAHRFFDQLPFWKPSEAIVEQLRVLLATREQLVQQRTSNQNALLAVRRKMVKTPPAEEAFTATIDHLQKQIKQLDQEIKDRSSGHPTFGSTVGLIMTIPGVGVLLAAHLLTLSDGFTKPLEARHVASHLGVCPQPFQSGTSIHRKSKSRGGGHPRLRKLLFLAAMNLRAHQMSFKEYFIRKTQAGKAGRLVINNIENRLLKIICAIIRTRTPYISDYRSVNPMFLQKVA
jgi:transposase